MAGQSFVNGLRMRWIRQHSKFILRTSLAMFTVKFLQAESPACFSNITQWPVFVIFMSRMMGSRKTFLIPSRNWLNGLNGIHYMVLSTSLFTPLREHQSFYRRFYLHILRVAWQVGFTLIFIQAVLTSKVQTLGWFTPPMIACTEPKTMQCGCFPHSILMNIFTWLANHLFSHDLPLTFWRRPGMQLFNALACNVTRFKA